MLLDGFGWFVMVFDGFDGLGWFVMVVDGF